MRRGTGRHLHAARLDCQCGCGKVGYASRPDAEHAAKVARRQNAGPMRAYRCNQGACWHIANALPTKRRTRR